MDKPKTFKAKILETKYFGFIIGFIVFLVFVLLSYGIGIIQDLDRALLDLQFNLKGDILSNAYGEKRNNEGVKRLDLNPRVSGDIVLVGIDNESLDTFGNWPFPRSVEAGLINTFSRIKNQDQRERAIFLDINFVERDTKVPLNDVFLLQSISENDRVYIEAFFQPSEMIEDLNRTNLERFELIRKRFGEVKKSQVEGDWRKLYAYQSVEAPLAPYIESCAGLGNVTTNADPDGVFRRQALVTRLATVVKEMSLDELTVNEIVDPDKFEYLGWKDNLGAIHEIPYPITENTLRSLPAILEGKAPKKDADLDNDGKIDTSYYIVRKYRNHVYPTITLDLALRYFNRTLDDVEIHLGKYVRIRNPESFDKSKNKWDKLVKNEALYEYPRVFAADDFENNILARVSDNRDAMRLLSNYFMKSEAFGKYVLKDDFDAKAMLPIQNLLADIGYENMKLVRKKEIYSSIDIPVDNRANMLINYMGKPSSTTGNKSYYVYPFTRFANDPGPNRDDWRTSQQVANKIIIVGMFATGFADEKPTPYGLMYGPEINANALNTIIMNNFITYADLFNNILILFAITLLTSFIVSRLPTFVSLVFALLELILLFALTQVLFDIFNYIIVFTVPALSIVVTFITIVTYRVMTEEKEKKKIKSMFGKYVSPQVVENLLVNPPELGGVDKELTVLFSDIRGFTTLSETMTPQELVNHLNVYLTAMTDIILEYKGTLDKYVGDEVMCFWGAPLPEPEHALLACMCALKQIDALKTLNEQWPPERRINIGIGLNSGIMTVGNMGSPGRMNYTLMGDNVNLGARLEGTNKQYSTTIIISENTYSLVKDQVIVRELDNIRVKGKNKPVLIYELLDMVGSYELSHRTAV